MRFLRRVMSHKDNALYPENHVIYQVQLNSLRPGYIVRWMCLNAYGAEVPGPNNKPLQARSLGLGFAKKAISYFMVNKHTKWNVEHGTGNPTMSVAVNELIKVVRKLEVQKQGKKSNTKKDLKRPEFRLRLRILERSNDFNQKHRTPAMKTFQTTLLEGPMVFPT
jgi:hypothetical protein